MQKERKCYSEKMK